MVHTVALVYALVGIATVQAQLAAPPAGPVESDGGGGGATSVAMTYLYGWDWGAERDQRDVVTAEFATVGRWGSQYVFVEAYELLAVRPGSERTPTIYAEWHPRLSLTQLSGGRLSAGPLSQVNLAGELNLSDGASATQIGVGFEWDVPRLNWLFANVSIRDDRREQGRTWNVLAALEASPSAYGQAFRIYAYIDVSGAEGGSNAKLYSESQLLLDLTGLLGSEPGHLFGGAELHVSRSVFDEGVEVVPQLTVQWLF